MHTVYGQNVSKRFLKFQNVQSNCLFPQAIDFQSDHDSTERICLQKTVFPNTVFEMKWDIDAVQICPPQQ